MLGLKVKVPATALAMVSADRRFSVHARPHTCDVAGVPAPHMASVATVPSVVSRQRTPRVCVPALVPHDTEQPPQVASFSQAYVCARQLCVAVKEPALHVVAPPTIE